MKKRILSMLLAIVMIAAALSTVAFATEGEVASVPFDGTTASYATIDASATPATGGSVEGAGAYLEGETVTLTATANPGYEFVNWTKGGSVVSTNATINITVTEAADYVAHFAQRTYTIGIAQGTGKSSLITGGERGVVYGSSHTVTATPAKGYTFVNWTVNDVVVSTNASYTFTVTGDCTCVANFEAIPYTVAVAETENGTVSVNKTNVIVKDQITITATPAPGYILDAIKVYKTGEETETVAVSNGRFIMPACDVTVKVTFKLNVPHDIILKDDNGVTEGGSYSVSPTSAKAGETVTITVAPETDYVAVVSAFGMPLGYSCSVTQVNDTTYTFVMPSDPVKVEASFYKPVLSVTCGEETRYAFDLAEAFYIAAGLSEEYNVAPVTIKVLQDYVEEYGGTSFYNYFPVTLDLNGHHIYFEETFWDNSGAMPCSLSLSDYQNKVGSVRITQDGEYAKLSLTDSSASKTGFLHAMLEVMYGTLRVDSGTYYGLVFPADTKISGGTFLGMPQEIIAIAPEDLYEKWIGSISAFPASVYYPAYTDEVSARAAMEGIVADGYAASNAVVASKSPSGYWLAGFPANTTVVKTFYDVAVYANPTLGGTVTGGGTYNYGSTVTLTAEAAAGYRFVNWTKEGEVVSTSATYSFTATEHAEYVANFEEYHTHCVCGATHAAIGTHITEENPTWIAISSASDFTKNKDSGYYYLTNDIEVSAKWDFTESRDIVLCLNGYDITYTGSSNVSFIPGSTALNFILTDCQDDAGSISGFKNTYGGAINVKKAFTMYNGKITGNTANQGGGVYVDQDATFYMYGGEITGNKAASIGGGVFSKGSMEVAGAPVVNNNESSNTATTYPSSMYKYTKNIYSSTGAIRVGTGGLATGALLDVTPMFPVSSSEKPAAVAVIATGCTSDLSEYFTYTSGFDYIKKYDAAKGEVQLVYNPVKYIVTFDMQGHGTQLEPQEVETGTYALEPTPAPTAVGYQFGGWYITPECGYFDNFIFDFFKITENTTLYAKWTEKATVSISEDVQAYTWDGNAKAFIISGNPETNFVVQYKVNDNWTEAAPSAMGTYDVKITREEDTIYKAYEKMIGGGLVINAATPTVTVPTVEADLVYDGTSQSLIAEGTSENGHWEYSLDGTNYLTTVPAGTDAKTYTVYCNFVPNTGYTGVDPVELSVTITPKEVGLDWAELTAAELVYNGTAKTLTATATDLVVGDSCTVTVELVGDNVNAGTFSYKATALSNANYKLPPNISSPEYTITPKTLTITADDKEVYVGNDQPELTYTVEGLVGSDVLITAPTLSTDANMYNAGTYAITFANEAAAGNNYSITYVNGTLTVKNNPYSPTITPIYDVKIADDITGGEVSVSRKLAYKGTTITITIAPDAGYELAKLIVTDSRGNAVAVTKASDNTYTFKMPASKITVKAAFAVENPFEDVSSDAYYYDAVLWAVKVGITSGTGATTFSPDNPCTRAQMATFLWRAAGSPDPVSKTCIFVDVPADAYYATAVQWAYEQGITSGTGATTYSPDEPCTRGQMATFLWRNAGSQAPVSNTNRFADVPAVKYYAVAVQWAYEQGITSGTSATTYSPDEPCTRGQVVTFLYRYYVK